MDLWSGSHENLKNAICPNANVSKIVWETEPEYYTIWNSTHAYGFACTAILRMSWAPIIEPLNEQSLQAK